MAAPIQKLLFVFVSYLLLLTEIVRAQKLPLVINTWPFTNATQKAWETIQNSSYLDALVIGCSECETLQCKGTVGYGGSPDEHGETTLDAMIMDGETHGVGSVGDLRSVKDAIAVARAVMDFTTHTLIVGKSGLTSCGTPGTHLERNLRKQPINEIIFLSIQSFAIEMGFKESNLTTENSARIEKDWLNNNCQPNYRQNVMPNHNMHCGPYRPATRTSTDRDIPRLIDRWHHDTIGMIVVDKDGKVGSGTSTNGASHKIPGRVGDSPIVGAGSYASGGVGGAAATGDGDIMMRFLPSFHTVMLMAEGAAPKKAAEKSLIPIIKAYPKFSGALVAADTKGNFGAACHGLSSFEYSVRSPDMAMVKVITILCI